MVLFVSNSWEGFSESGLISGDGEKKESGGDTGHNGKRGRFCFSIIMQWEDTIGLLLTILCSQILDLQKRKSGRCIETLFCRMIYSFDQEWKNSLG